MIQFFIYFYFLFKFVIFDGFRKFMLNFGYSGFTYISV